jgi:hypothetical protein
MKRGSRSASARDLRPQRGREFVRVKKKLSSIFVAYDVHLADRIRSILNRSGEFSEKKMFGGLAFMVNCHMCCGVLKTDLVLRLTPADANLIPDQWTSLASQ